MAQPTTAVPALEREVPKQEGPKQEVLKKEENEAKSELERVKLEAQTGVGAAQARGRRSGLKEGKGRGAASKRGSGTRKGRSTNQHATEQMIRRNVRQNTEPFFNSIEG